MPPLLHGQAEAGRHRRPGGALPAPLRRPQGQEVDRAQLQQVKLRALARDNLGSGDAVPEPFGEGAALVDGEARAVVLTAGGLGGALAWSLKRGAGEVHVIADTHAAGASYSRQAELFAVPVHVWLADGRNLKPMPNWPATVAVPASERWADAIRSTGADAVVEHGVLHGEVRGLEVAVVDDDVLRVGVNESDRQAHEELRSDAAPLEALARVVAHVREVRVAGSDHPLCWRDRDRWMRSAVVADPALVGLSVPLRAAPWRATAVGDGVLVGCGAGTDLEVVVRAADAAAAVGADRTVIALPAGDDLPSLRRLAAALRTPAAVIAVETPPWLS